jgi:hypothetical protein
VIVDSAEVPPTFRHRPVRSGAKRLPLRGRDLETAAADADGRVRFGFPVAYFLAHSPRSACPFA